MRGGGRVLLEENVVRRSEEVPSWRSRGRSEGRFETESSVRIEIGLPGVDRHRVHVDVEGGVLFVRVDRSVTFIGDEDTLYMVDDRFSGFERRFALPVSVDIDGVRAFFSRDTLTIVMPKRPMRRSISVESRPTMR